MSRAMGTLLFLLLAMFAGCTHDPFYIGDNGAPSCAVHCPGGCCDANERCWQDPKDGSQWCDLQDPPNYGAARDGGAGESRVHHLSPTRKVPNS